jgi:hypothetical protein
MGSLSLKPVGYLDGDPIKRFPIDIAFHFGLTKVRREYPPETASTADKRCGLHGGYAQRLEHFQLTRTYEEVARGNVVNKNAHAPAEGCRATSVRVASDYLKPFQRLARKSAAGDDSQPIILLIVDLQRSHIGASYGNNSIYNMV